MTMILTVTISMTLTYLISVTITWTMITNRNTHIAAPISLPTHITITMIISIPKHNHTTNSNITRTKKRIPDVVAIVIILEIVRGGAIVI